MRASFEFLSLLIGTRGAIKTQLPIAKFKDLCVAPSRTDDTLILFGKRYTIIVCVHVLCITLCSLTVFIHT